MLRSSLFAPVVLGLSLFAAACAPPTQDVEEWEEIAEDEGALRVCAEGETVDGIDVSYWQEKVNWDGVASSGIGFAIVRLSYGSTFKDPRFEENWSGSKNAGLVRGAYQYFKPSHDAEEQAQLFIDMLANDPIGQGDLPAVLDVETTDGLSKTKVRAAMKVWLEKVEAATGKKPIIYTAAFMQDVIGDEFAEYPLWVANYTSQCPLVPSGWDDWSMWQYTDKGKVGGVTGNVDRNVFNGSMADLLAFADGGVAPQPEPEPDPTEPQPEDGSPTNLTPADGSSVSGDEVTLRCDAVGGANGYTFEIEWFSASSNAWKSYYAYETSKPEKTYWPVVDAPFRFRVRAHTADGTTPFSGWSAFGYNGTSPP